jgi:hypothetical protein
VSGFTKKHDQRERGSARLSAAIRARSAGSSLGREICRRRTVSLVAQDEQLKVLGGATAREQGE